MPSKLITIGQILEMAPGDRQNAAWVNDDFEAVVSDVKIGSGKAPSTAVLTDPHNPGIAIVGNFFGVDPSRFAGKIVHVSGKGIARTEYKGVQQVTMGDKATIQIVGTAGPAPARSAAPAGAASTQGPSAASAIHGATVGMAINQAASILREFPNCSDGREHEYFTGSDFSKDLWTIASDILRVSRVLESGKLATSPKERNEPPEVKAAREAEAQAEAAKAEAARIAKEEAERRAANLPPAGTGDLDEDVPF
jgi:hypothetical protein